jgi:hypothetical protein
VSIASFQAKSDPVVFALTRPFSARVRRTPTREMRRSSPPQLALSDRCRTITKA